MAHQYVHEVLGERNEAPHGSAFQAVCERLGIDPASSGLPSAAPYDDATARAVERIARLLALAESPNVHEAEAATLAAQRLMLKYNIDALTRPPAGYDFRTLGVPRRQARERPRDLRLAREPRHRRVRTWVLDPLVRSLVARAPKRARTPVEP
jgi:hypothetical protein